MKGPGGEGRYLCGQRQGVESRGAQVIKGMTMKAREAKAATGVVKGTARKATKAKAWP